MIVCWIGWNKIHFWDKVVGHWKPKQGFQVVNFSLFRSAEQTLLLVNDSYSRSLRKRYLLTVSEILRVILSMDMSIFGRHIQIEIFEKLLFFVHDCILCLFNKLRLNLAIFDRFNLDFRDSRTTGNYRCKVDRLSRTAHPKHMLW